MEPRRVGCSLLFAESYPFFQVLSTQILGSAGTYLKGEGY